MRLAALLACLTIAGIHPAPAADPPEAPGASGKEAPAAVQAPVGALPVSTTPATATPDTAAAETVASGTVTPATAASAMATPATATATAANNTSAATASDADSDAARLEKRMVARGFRTRMENGEKFFCRREEVLGTRLGGALHCMNAAEARAYEGRVQQEEEQLRQRLNSGACINSGGHSMTCSH